jgi:hypothetical protein
MKWNVNDMDTYLKSKEYVDTALVPLIPIQWEKEIKTTVSMGEFILLISYQLERQFKGRLILFPEFSYLRSEPLADRTSRLIAWEEELNKGGIKHLFYITSDSEWRDKESTLLSNLLWLPYIPLEHVEEKYKEAMMTEQMNQLIPLFTNAWKKE